jgi:hypothetical protein
LHVVATFEQSIFVELAITALEQKQIPKDQILAVPLDKRTAPRRLFDTIHRADGFSLFDASAVLGTVFMLLGAIYGFELAWGPIIWGIIGAISGIILGFLLKVIIFKKQGTAPGKITSEVVLIIRCESHQWDTIEKILWDNNALGLSSIHRNP